MIALDRCSSRASSQTYSVGSTPVFIAWYKVMRSVLCSILHRFHWSSVHRLQQSSRDLGRALRIFNSTRWSWPLLQANKQQLPKPMQCQPAKVRETRDARTVDVVSWAFNADPRSEIGASGGALAAGVSILSLSVFIFTSSSSGLNQSDPFSNSP